MSKKMKFGIALLIADLIGFILMITVYGKFKVPVGEGHYIYRMGIQDSKGYETSTTWYEAIPDKILNAFEKEGLSVSYQGHFNFHGGEQVLGYTLFDDNDNCTGIFVRNDGKFDNSDINFTIAHEFGHYFDNLLGDISSSDEWKEITADECYYSQSCLVYTPDGNYYYEDPAEFFAEEFAYYVLGGIDQEYEAECCIEAQKYIENVVAEYCSVN